MSGAEAIQPAEDIVPLGQYGLVEQDKAVSQPSESLATQLGPIALIQAAIRERTPQKYKRSLLVFLPVEVY